MKPKTHSPIQTLVFAMVFGVAFGGALAPRASADTNCVAPPSGLVSWWRAETDAADAMGGNSGILKNGAGFGIGKVGQAFDFRGTDVPWPSTNTPPPIPGSTNFLYPGSSNVVVYRQYVEIPDSSGLNPPGSFSIEGWIFPRRDGMQEILAKWGASGERSYSLHTLKNRAIRFAISDAAHQNDGSFHIFDTPTNVLSINGWNHIAAVYDQAMGARRIYVNGVQAAERIDPPITVISNAAKVTIGMIVGLYYFDGLIDELSFYAKALSGEEVQAIYNAVSGKCLVPVSPFIISQPVNQMVFAGETATFTVSAGGIAPLSYQWQFNGTNVSDGTSSTLTLTNVQLSQSGDYAVVVTNVAGSITSSNAALIVTNTPPIILAQPRSRSVIVGRDVSFTVAAAGTRPLSYQWSFNGTGIGGATGSSLTLVNVQLTAAGTYTVQVTNTVGVTDSADAVLTVNSSPPCVAPPQGLVGWWRAETDASDTVGGSHGTLRNGASFGLGKVGQSFDFNGVNQFVSVPSSAALNPPGSFSIEGWIFPRQDAVKQIISKWGGSGERSYSFHTLQNRAIRFAMSDAAHQNDASYHIFDTTNNVLTLNGWNHVAAVYDQAAGARQIYVNGVKVAERLDPPTTVVSNGATVNIGMIVGTYYFNGLIDELSFYGKALSGEQVRDIYDSDSGGKCMGLTPPFILTPPANQSVFVGGTAVFTVSAGGTAPLSYQWQRNGTNIAEATSSILTLTNVQLSQAGDYAVVVTNSAGSTISSNALLTVANEPPTITQQPQSQTVVVGRNISFTVGAVGTLPLSYQWRLNGTEMGGATTSSLTLTNVQLTDAGTYAVQVSNAAGSTNSADAVLTVNESSALSFLLNVNFAADPPKVKAGMAATGQGINDYWNRQWAPWQPSDAVSNLKLADGTVTSIGLTVLNAPGAHGNGSSDPMYDTFVYPQNGGNVTVTFTNLPAGQYDVYVYGYDGNYQVTVGDTDYGVRTNREWPIVSPPVWQEGRQYSLFRAVEAGGGQALTVTARCGGLDPSALISGIQIMRLGEVSNAPPTIVSQPASRSVFVGADTTFTVPTTGTRPLSYQWSFNGTSLGGATGISLTLTNVQLTDAGTYTVAVSNAAGSMTSSNALLTVTAPPATVQVSSLDASAGSPVTVPVQLVANGDENALGFSLSFDPALLGYTGASLGSGAIGSTLMLNTNSLASGTLGFTIAQPAGVTFAVGTQEVVQVQFVTALVTNASSTTISFGDQPALRQLLDGLGNALPATYASGTVSVAAANFEGDVSLWLGGDKEVTTIDWVMVGRYVAGLSYPASGSEFQQADCAPLSELGDGSLKATDWVQAGRYAAGLDPVTRAGGPTSAGSGGREFQKVLAQANSANPASRQVQAKSAILMPGQTGTICVNLKAQGDENALGFSLTFDPGTLQYVGATLGTDAPGAALNLNTNQISLGRLGVVLALPPGATLPAGTREVVKVNLRTVSPATGSSPVAFSDQPVICAVSDSLAGELATAYVNGIVAVNPVPSLAIAQLGQEIALSWPLWATNFVLQAVDGAPPSSGVWTNLSVDVDVSNEECRVTLPVSGEAKFYRLSLP